MRLNDLKPDPGSRPKGMRKGRGIGSGKGRTAGRGTKGQTARNTVRVGFEGGQTPLQRRLPFSRGIRKGLTGNLPDKTIYTPINVGDLAKFDPATPITPEVLMAAHLVRNPEDKVKILGTGEITQAFTVRAHAFSQSAIDKIQAAGGTAETL
ncbi:MAG: 50S ribosomal protein L15 [Armatimonadetes bacterium]|nr:50S ribosomal protein L15 [Armatimonadota bacterium]